MLHHHCLSSSTLRHRAVRALLSLSLVALGACGGAADTVTGSGGGGGTAGAPARLDVSTTAVSLSAVGASEGVTATVRDAQGRAVSGAIINWSSSDITIADVAGVGTTAVITARAPGRTTIRAQMGNFAQDIVVNVLAVRTITLTPTAATLRAGDQFTLAAAVDADAGASLDLRWVSENAAVAAVSAQGVVTGIAPGTTNVRVNSVGDPRVTATAQVIVTSARSVQITPASSTTYVGDRQRFRATVQVDSTQATTVTWSSADPSILTVAEDGEVTALAVGTTRIRAISTADPRARDSATVRVLAARQVSVTPATVQLATGETRMLDAQVAIEAGMSRDVTWRSDDPSVVMVATNGWITGVSQGSTTVTAISVADTTRQGSALITVVPVVRDVNVSPAAATMYLGDTRQFVASISADPGVSPVVLWRSSNPAVASVNNSGIVTALAAGSTIVTVLSQADTTQRASALVTVRYAPIVTITPTSVTLDPGQTRQFAAVVQADVGVSTAVTWQSSNPSIATVSGTGLVTAVASGATVIVATSVADTSRSAAAIVQVSSVVRSIAVTPASVSLSLNQQQQLVAAVTADPGLSTAVTWQTSDAAVASVSAAGVVTAIGFGSAQVTAVAVADTTRRASATISVAPQVLSVSVSPASASLQIGQSVQLTPSVAAQGGLSTAVTYRSSNPSVASVNFAGNVTAMGNGSATVTVVSVADTTRRASAAITVSNSPPPPPPPTTRLATSWSSTRLGGPLYEDVLSIDAIDAANAFAVNSVGDIYRYTSGTWALTASGASYGTRFLSVSGASTNAVFAVGTNGVIVRFNGATWSTLASGTTRTLNAVFMESAGAGFIVGDNGTALRWNGANWSSLNSTTSETLTSVWSVGGVAWAVGDNGTIVRYNGAVFAPQNSPSTEALNGVYGTSLSSVVAVGNYGEVLRYNGTAWTRVSDGSITADLYAVGGGVANGGRMYIASDAGLLQLDGSQVSTAGTPYAPRLQSVSYDATGNVWTGGQRGSVMRLASGAWSTINLAPDLMDVWTTAANNAWAVGEFGFVYRWNGSSWSRQSTPTTATLTAVWGASSTEAFAGGENGTMLRWNGSSWTPMTFPTADNVYALWGTSSSNVYAATAGGEVLRFNGSSWSNVLTVTGALWAVHGSSASDVVVSGENGLVRRFDGTSWSSIAAPTTSTMAGIWSGASSNVVAVGADPAGTAGVAFGFGGSSWSALPTGTTRLLTSVWGPAGTDLYATGDQGTILRFNGTSWSAMSSGTTDLLWSLSGAPDGSGGAFAVGYNSTLVTGVSGFVQSGFRMSSVSSIGGAGRSLEPARGATVVRGALRDGKLRMQRGRVSRTRSR
jgi:uncharacterized protein YjdB